MQKANDLSLFDILGPVMIGPSSSHTAGAVRIALLARSFCAGVPITSVEFELYGSFANTYKGHGTDRALLAGIMGMSQWDPRIRDAYELAKASGLKYRFKPNKFAPCNHPNTVDLTMHLENGKEIKVQGVSLGGGASMITSLNGVPLEFTGLYHTLLTKHLDCPGILSKITGVFAKHNINIATVKVYRDAKGEKAYALFETDEPMDGTVEAALETFPEIYTAIFMRKLAETSEV